MVFMKQYWFFIISLLHTALYAQQIIVPIGQEMSNSQGSASVSIGQVHYVTLPEVWSGVQQPSWTFYSIVTKSDVGLTIGDGKYRVGDTATIAAATADLCYSFARWSDNETSNPRTLTVTQDSTLTAIFEKINYTITLDADEEKGKVVEEENK